MSEGSWVRGAKAFREAVGRRGIAAAGSRLGCGAPAPLAPLLPLPALRGPAPKSKPGRARAENATMKQQEVRYARLEPNGTAKKRKEQGAPGPAASSAAAMRSSPWAGRSWCTPSGLLPTRLTMNCRISRIAWIPYLRRDRTQERRDILRI